MQAISDRRGEKRFYIREASDGIDPFKSCPQVQARRRGKVNHPGDTLPT
jgi:hypothetical protein